VVSSGTTTDNDTAVAVAGTGVDDLADQALAASRCRSCS